MKLSFWTNNNLRAARSFTNLGICLHFSLPWTPYQSRHILCLLRYTGHSSDIRNTSIFRRCWKRSILKYFLKKHYKNTKAWKLAFVSSIFKYFLKSPKKRKIRVCLKKLRVCHYYDTECSREHRQQASRLLLRCSIPESWWYLWTSNITMILLESTLDVSNSLFFVASPYKFRHYR